jgi:hypothetical protein
MEGSGQLHAPAAGTHWIGGWMGPRAVLAAVVKRKIPSPAGNRTLEPAKINSEMGRHNETDIR